MTRRKQPYTTRDPRPTIREPDIQTRDMTPEERKPVPSIFVPIPKCPHCGCTVWREGGSTRANPMSREMVRWRSCRDCGRSVWIRRPMDRREIAQHCPPV